MTTFTQFIELKLRNAWLREPGLDIYVRRSILPNRGDFELANINADKPGNGAFTRFLERWEPEYSFFIENVLNNRLTIYLERRGYQRVNGREAPCYLKERVK